MGRQRRESYKRKPLCGSICALEQEFARSSALLKVLAERSDSMGAAETGAGARIEICAVVRGRNLRLRPSPSMNEPPYLI